MLWRTLSQNKEGAEGGREGRREKGKKQFNNINNLLLNFRDKVIFEFLVNQRNKGITNYRNGKKATPQIRPGGVLQLARELPLRLNPSAFPDSARVIGSEGSLQLPATKPTPRVITNSLINLSAFSICVAGLQILATGRPPRMDAFHRDEPQQGCSVVRSKKGDGCRLKAESPSRCVSSSPL